MGPAKCERYPQDFDAPADLFEHDEIVPRNVSLKGIEPMYQTFSIDSRL